MIILSKYAKKLKTFSSYSLNDKLLLIKVFLLTGLFRLEMLYMPFKKLKKHMGQLNEESSDYIEGLDYKMACKISWAIKKIVKYTPWESRCLVQSLTAQYLLHHMGIGSTLYLGVSKDSIFSDGNNNLNNNKSNIIAHSWIRCGQLYLTGGNGDKFAVVAKFRK